LPPQVPIPAPIPDVFAARPRQYAKWGKVFAARIKLE
jgi:hypothetical protein